jgi:hypothetical protein
MTISCDLLLRLVKDRAIVDVFYKAAMAAGGRDDSAPGIRAHYHPNYHGAFVLDPDDRLWNIAASAPLRHQIEIQEGATRGKNADRSATGSADQAGTAGGAAAGKSAGKSAS